MVELNKTEMMLEWNLTGVVSSLSTGLSKTEQESVMEALTDAMETEHMVEQAFRARRQRTKFVRSTPESEKITHNFRTAKTLQEAFHNGITFTTKSIIKIPYFSF